MNKYKVIGLDLAKKKFHFVAVDFENKVVLKKMMSRKDFFDKVSSIFPLGEIFAMEACGGAHYTAQKLEEIGYKVILLKAKDVKPYAKIRQKNDVNDSIAICKAALDSELMHVKYKTKEQQEVAYLHKARQNTIQQRIQRSNSLITSLFEFGYDVECGKTRFAKSCKDFIKAAFEEGFITNSIFEQMELDCEEIKDLMDREKKLDKVIVAKNKNSSKATLLQTIPGIGPINASILFMIQVLALLNFLIYSSHLQEVGSEARQSFA
jgi:transposase